MFFREDLSLPAFPANSFLILPAVRGAQQWSSVCSGASEQPPRPDARLAAAPYWNIDSNGAVCAGTMRAPKSLTVASIPAWQQAFFQSEFTHPGGAGRLTKRKGGTAALWKSLAGKKIFPRSTLIEMEPLNEYLRKLEAAQR
jgi:PRTRC genetic system protein B